MPTPPEERTGLGSGRASIVRAGLARALRVLLAIAAVAAAVALPVGVGTGSGAGRALSVGWYVSGAFVLLLGFVISSRGPTRAEESLGWRARSRRWATRSEQEESINASAFLVVLGLALIVLGVLVDPRHPVF